MEGTGTRDCDLLGECGLEDEGGGCRGSLGVGGGDAGRYQDPDVVPGVLT